MQILVERSMCNCIVLLIRVSNVSSCITVVNSYHFSELLVVVLL